MSTSVEEEIISSICSYPEVNPFSWSPGISNLIPAPRNDHQYDTEEFLQALRDLSPPGGDSVPILSGWYGVCPLGVYNIYDPAPTLFPGYVSPAPVPQLSSETAIDFVDHIHPSGHHAIMRVRIGGEDRVLKIVRTTFVSCAPTITHAFLPLYSSAKNGGQKSATARPLSDAFRSSEMRTLIYCNMELVPRVRYRNVTDGLNSPQHTFKAQPL